ncbi:MAG: hypothetical protein WB816_01720 [Methylocystis sp.]
MTMHVIPEGKGSPQWKGPRHEAPAGWAKKIVDLLWAASMVATLAFGALVVSMFAIGLASNFHMIEFPQAYCDYMPVHHKFVETCQ